MSTPVVEILGPDGQPLRNRASSYQGAGAGFGGQLQDWHPVTSTVDAALLPQLDLGNARADDVVRNNAFASNGVQLHIDNIVGHLFRLSYKPRYQRLGISEDDARAFARDVEAWWMEYAEDPDGCWLDAERKSTFTMLVRQAIGVHTRSGEVMAVAQWRERAGINLRTCIKMISPKRVCNPGKLQDRPGLRAGIEINRDGAALAYHVRNTDSVGLFGDGMGHRWKRIRKRAANGRLNFLHIFEPTEDGQTRGANQFLTVLEQMQMLPKMQHTKLQNAIVHAMYAATLESDLGPEAASQILGADDGTTKLASYMANVIDYHSSNAIKMNGVKVPQLLPFERLNMQTSGNADNGYADLESSVLRWLAAGLNVPFEPFAKDYRGSSYSSARSSMLEGWRYYMGRRKVIASRFGAQVFGLAFEEALHRGELTLPRGATRNFYEGKAAWCHCDFIGAGRLAIDGLKEVKEAVLRIESGLSTYEKELALMGEDYQETFKQQIRETQERKDAGLPPPSWMRVQALGGETVEEATT
ncbi:MAG: phage portal protein [Marinobacterium sp.]|nr:phage portal protein [Marinobacterium sp.]